MREVVFWIVIFIILILTMRDSFIGLCAYLSLNVVRPEILFWGGGPSVSVLLILFLTLIVSCLVNGKMTLKGLTTRPSSFLFWLYASLLLSLFFSKYDVTMGFRYVNEILILAILCGVVHNVAGDLRRIVQMEKVLLGALTFLGIWGIEQYLAGNYRIEGLGGNSYMDSNGVAAMYVLFIPVALHLILYGDRSQRWLWLAAGMVMISLVICTFSRGGAVGLAVALVAYVVRTRYKVRMIALAAVLFVLALPFVSSEYLDRLGTVKSTESMDASGLSRIILWKTGWEIFKDNPIIGTGFLTFAQAKEGYKERFLGEGDTELLDYVFRSRKVGHNTYMQILSECGLFGAFSYFGMIGTALLVSFRSRRGWSFTGDPHGYAALMLAIESGIIGFCVCIFAIDALVDVFLPIQIAVVHVLSKLGAPSGERAAAVGVGTEQRHIVSGDLATEKGFR